MLLRTFFRKRRHNSRYATYEIAENSENSSFYQWGIAEHYNESVKDYKETQYYILLEKNENDIYQEFNGVKKQFTSTLF